MSRISTRVLLAAALLGLTIPLACEKDDVGSTDTGKVGEGGACEVTPQCRSEDDLVCARDGTCTKKGQPGTASAGEGCASTGDCQLELICGSTGTCAKPGQGGKGSPCKGGEDCGVGLVCSGALTCEAPGSPGTKAAGEACESVPECQLGLVCVAGECAALQFWPGVTCAPDSGPFRAHFEIPRGGKALGEFYRLPFPNDIRVKNGHVDISGHPNPAINLPQGYGDVVGEYVKRINADVTGWGVQTAVLLRTSGKAQPDNPTAMIGMDLKTLVLQGDNKTIEFLNIDPDSSGYGAGVSLQMFASTGKGKYICNNWIGVRPKIGAPLEPETTYAVLLRKGIKNDSGEEATQDADFKIVIGDSEPTDADEKHAWEAYKPLRDYLADKNINASTVLSAAVFTTMNPRAHMSRLRETVREQTAPSVAEWTLCDGTAKSPCDDGKEATHACATSVDDKFHELQGIYKTPVFQAGTPPYKTVADGGLISWDATSGKPKVDREENVCVAMTVPKATMPADGWPVAIFAHGTGGSYRSFITNGTAAALANVSDQSGDVAKMVVISIDGSMHGPRRGSDDDPKDLFFNLANPAAARDNTYQGVADKFQLVRLLESLDLDGAGSPTGEALKIDTSKIYFFGHSQGTIEGVPFAAYESLVDGVVLSGAGGYLISSFLDKTKPVNISAAVQFVLSDTTLGSVHPLLNLMQLYFEEVDTLNYGRALFAAPVEGQDAKHTFLSYGLADSFTPPSTIQALAKVMSIKQVNQPAARCGDGVCSGDESCNSCAGDCPANACEPAKMFPLIDPPVSGNQNATPAPVTAAMVPYVSDGSYDDHQVLFNNPTAKAQSQHFLGSAARDGTPTIPAP